MKVLKLFRILSHKWTIPLPSHNHRHNASSYVTVKFSSSIQSSHSHKHQRTTKPKTCASLYSKTWKAQHVRFSSVWRQERISQTMFMIIPVSCGRTRSHNCLPHRYFLLPTSCDITVKKKQKTQNPQTSWTGVETWWCNMAAVSQVHLLFMQKKGL